MRFFDGDALERGRDLQLVGASGRFSALDGRERTRGETGAEPAPRTGVGGPLLGADELPRRQRAVHGGGRARRGSG